MNCEKVSDFIINWLKEQLTKSGQSGFVVGVSGGVDSALVSILCAKTGILTYAVSLPINQAEDQLSRATEHIEWLIKNNSNIQGIKIDLTHTNKSFLQDMGILNITDLARANTQSRLRMTALYAIANCTKSLVTGTGNAVEDGGGPFGGGCKFFTKYGDGGVDISPISSLLKSEVRELSRFLGILPKLCEAVPTDGLWLDNRSDESQLGASYDELEIAMKFANYWRILVTENSSAYTIKTVEGTEEEVMEAFNSLNEREKKVLAIYCARSEAGKHKLEMPPVCKFPGDIKN